MLAVGQAVASQPREFAAVVRQVIQVFRRAIERRGEELRISLVGRDVRQRLGFDAPEIDVAVIRRAQLTERDPLRIGRHTR